MQALTFEDEIRRVHRFFEDWFAGRDGRDFAEFDDAMVPGFSLVSPDGDLMVRDRIVDAVRSGRGSGIVEIRIVRPTVGFDDGTTVVGTYEEHQAKRGTSSSRQSSVVLRRHRDAPGGWMWHAVHETWISPPQPDAQTSRPSSR